MKVAEVPETYRIFAHTLQEVATRLTLGWVFDPWLCSKGYPIMIGENMCYWVLVNPKLLASPEQLAAANPHMQLPAEPVAEAPAGYGTVFVPHGASQEEYTKKGYVLLHKDHADVVGPDKVKGTILTLTKKPEEAKTDAS